MLHRISLAGVLATVWLLWSGQYKALFLGLGALSVALVVTLSVRMRVVDNEGAPVDVPLRAVLYLPWLVWQIVLSNLDVMRRIVQPGPTISPRLITLPTRPRSEIGRAILANSITLTPGTVTVDVADDHFTVHALTEEAAASLLEGEMERRVCRVEGRAS